MDTSRDYAMNLEALRRTIDPLSVACPRCPDVPAGAPCTVRDWHGNPVTHDMRRTAALMAYLAERRG